jgi:DNA adenine methylase
MFFAVAPQRSILSDVNEELINAFKQVRQDPKYIANMLRKLLVDAETYCRIRESSPRSDRGRAVRFIYLNRTCYGGLHRTNLKGKFNVPYGGGSRTPTCLWRDGILDRASRVLNSGSCVLKKADFETPLIGAREGDVVYCDPTYQGTKRLSFDRYGERVFGWADQKRLVASAKGAVRKGATVIISNVATSELSDLYGDAIQIELVKRKAIGNRALNESSPRELLAVFDPLHRREFWLREVFPSLKRPGATDACEEHLAWRQAAE